MQCSKYSRSSCFLFSASFPLIGASALGVSKTSTEIKSPILSGFCDSHLMCSSGTSKALEVRPPTVMNRSADSSSRIGRLLLPSFPTQLTVTFRTPRSSAPAMIGVSSLIRTLSAYIFLSHEVVSAGVLMKAASGRRSCLGLLLAGYNYSTIGSKRPILDLQDFFARRSRRYRLTYLICYAPLRELAQVAILIDLARCILAASPDVIQSEGLIRCLSENFTDLIGNFLPECMFPFRNNSLARLARYLLIRSPLTLNLRAYT